ncbi:MAG: PKD domain-containing protein, partial [Saprospiraceae bacterium]|nr:PKD domain-containing protein [Saprospiraceae bacterium]
ISASATAGFTYNATGALVTFTNTGQNGNTFNWNFGDGNSSTVVSPSHQYTNNGSYTVVQTVTNGCGSVQSTQVITIALAPVTSFSSSYTGPICAGQSVSFTNTSTFSPTSYLWTFEGGNPATSTDPNPTVIYPSGGTFDVTLATTNSFGTTQSVLQNYVVVNDKPIISFSAIGDGLEVDFTQAIQFGTGHLWNFGDGQTSTATNPTHTYNAEGTYVVTLSDSNTCGTTTNSQNLLVQLLPTAGFSTTSTSVCIGNQVQFNNQSSPSVTAWNWTFEGGNPATSTLENPVVTYSQTGTYNVSLTVTNASGQNTNTIIDYMHVITVPSTEFDGIISGNTLTLDNTSISVASSNWNIFTDNINASLNGDHVIYTALQNGTYNVILTNTNQCGQSISDTVQYIINAYPIASYALNNGNPTCANQNVQFFAADGVGNTYNWAFTGGQPSTSNEQNPVILYNNAGTYTVRLIVSNIYGADTLDSNVNIGDLPTAAFTSVINNNQAQFTMTGNGHTSQTWNFGDGSNSSDLNPTHVYSASGNYTITLITSNGCGNDTIVQTVAIIISATDNYNDKVVFNLVPNPASDFINMEFDGFKTGEFKIAVTDLSGRKLIDQTLFLSGKQVQNMEISNLPAGAYFVKLTGTDIFKTKKLVVVR